MLNKVKEIISTPILREWFLYRLLHPYDRGVKVKARLARPDYLTVGPFVTDHSSFSSCLAMTPYSERLSYGEAVEALNLKKDFLLKESLMKTPVEDWEEHASYYRFQWLASYMMLGGEIDEVSRLIVSWCQSSIPFFDNAYTSAERISQWALFLERTQAMSRLSEDQRQLIKERIAQDVQDIIDNFEFYGPELTGNHLMANARGLVWAGYFLKSLDLLKHGKTIIEREVHRISPYEGMNREGSSHYQFLILRNLLECLMIFKQCGLDDLSNLERQVTEHAHSCLFFKTGNQMPFFGDISPDAPPDYLWHVPETALTYLETPRHQSSSQKVKGWASHFFNEVGEFSYQKNWPQIRGDFIRIEEHDVALITHFNSMGLPQLATHAHCDSGAPVLFCRGREVLIDPGRFDYGKLSEQYSSSLAHNVLIIDHKMPEEMRRGVFGRSFMKWRFSDGPQLTHLEHNFFSARFSSYRHVGIEVVRNYEIDKTKAILEFMVAGKGRHHLMIPFFVEKSIETDIFIYPEEGEFLVDDPRLLTTRSTCYGQKSPLKSFSWSSEVELPWRGVFEINLESL